MTTRFSLTLNGVRHRTTACRATRLERRAPEAGRYVDLKNGGIWEVVMWESIPSRTRIYRFVLASGVFSMSVGVLMLLVDGFSNSKLGLLYFIPQGAFLTLLGLRGRTKVPYVPTSVRHFPS